MNRLEFSILYNKKLVFSNFVETRSKFYKKKYTMCFKIFASSISILKIKNSVSITSTLFIIKKNCNYIPNGEL